MHYVKAPILEAALEFRWKPDVPLEAVRHAVSLPGFSGLEEPKERTMFNAMVDLQGGAISQQSRPVGYERPKKDGSEIAMLETDKFVFVKRAPYDQWKTFSERALALLRPVVESFGLREFIRIGTRFVNRIDIPPSGDTPIDIEDYITVQCDGPRRDEGIINEFQMRVVKPTVKEGISYALVVATTPSLLPNHTSIVIDIDVFTERAIHAGGSEFDDMLAEMRIEKNDIFHSCLKKPATDLFGGIQN